MKHWIEKFRNAFRGMLQGAIGETSFAVHLIASLCVVGLSLWLECDVYEWSILLLCIAFVFSLELINSALESLARGLCSEQNEHVGKALDIASGAVLCASIFAAIVGFLILGPKLIDMLFAQ